ncbi:HK97-gp10 family putative phage morphogenesis protein [Clostridium tepidum]|uniref:Phage protein, HK97 gp10 family n=2 Tax=Clostridium TaxID=1485 RepID=A0A7U4JPY0_CLOSG|nr:MULTISPECIES: HK97-gp10 family putative phage morphogenesis protein [Clostridium]MDU1422000.1 HK97 gp10 family phage protein [Clostridium botulinum]AKC63166.1 phage protein, HK97 gp10 family [Clostridium sporogenes]AKJ90361.1 phage protein, HK97 gp10 family [Clostridium sporogenes]KCZ67853.1 phage protein, HK97 gp10 family [Clostridium sporogenes]MBA4509930.1 HK97 gp10 family phage protein [Clostridium sporogenes]
MASMELDGLDELIRKVQDMGKAGVRVENAALKKAGELIVEEAKNNVPVKTEKLKKGLKVSGVRKKGGNKFVLAGIQKGDNSKIFYGKFLEFGTSKMKAQPFMGPAYESKKEEAKEIIKDELRKGLGL